MTEKEIYIEGGKLFLYSIGIVLTFPLVILYYFLADQASRDNVVEFYKDLSDRSDRLIEEAEKLDKEK